MLTSSSLCVLSFVLRPVDQKSPFGLLCHMESIRVYLTPRLKSIVGLSIGSMEDGDHFNVGAVIKVEL